MVNCQMQPMRLMNGQLVPAQADQPEGREGTIAYRILEQHNTSGDMKNLKIRFDGMLSHDITYVNIIQTARMGDMQEFCLPYVLTNCHNSLCAVGGTINEDDHAFGLSACIKYGGNFVPAHLAVIHQYAREMMAGCGKMLLGSDSHTRYGMLGTLGIGEGGPELVKQLLHRTYDISYPDVVAVYLTGKPERYVGPQDVALALIKAVFAKGLVKNKILEFIGPGVDELSVDFRGGIDVMTTETTCLSSVWRTDKKVRRYLQIHGRGDDYRELEPYNGALYDGAITIELDKIRPMIALPFHPSNVFTIDEFTANAGDILNELGLTSDDIRSKITSEGVRAEQGIIAGCSGGTFENLTTVAAMLAGTDLTYGHFQMSAYPASQPQLMHLLRNGSVEKLLASGTILRTAICGPCFGAGDVPQNGGLSLRHTTRNFPNREGSKPGEGQNAYVALMDARSIAATALRDGILTGADKVEIPEDIDYSYEFDNGTYNKRIYHGYGHPQPEHQLKYGPNISDWPKFYPMSENMVLEVAASIYDPVTTTDELIPSGDTSSYRSNPERLAGFALSRKVPSYVPKAKEVRQAEASLRASVLNGTAMNEKAKAMLDASGLPNCDIELGTLVFALKPGDGSAREQAASCQRVLGGRANIAREYATKRYRSNLINWGIIPFILPDAEASGIRQGDLLVLTGVRTAVQSGADAIDAELISGGEKRKIRLEMPLTADERRILAAGCLINYYKES
ncbi:MAG: hydratase [Clostridiales bacterium]|nr:hydratase [Clostridiales bacterium]